MNALHATLSQDQCKAHLQPGLHQIELYLLLSKPGVVLLTHPPLTCCCFLLVAGKQGMGNLASLHLHLLICIFNDVQQNSKGTGDSQHNVDATCAVPSCIPKLNVNAAADGFSRRHLHPCCETACTPYCSLNCLTRAMTHELTLLSHHCITIKFAQQRPVWQHGCTCSFALRASICFCESINLPGDTPLSLPGVGVCLLLEGPFA